jgi:hypothetical protein
MGRRLNQYLGSFGDDGRPKVVFVFDDEEAPADAEHVFRLNLKGRPALGTSDEAVHGERATAQTRRH